MVAFHFKMVLCGGHVTFPGGLMSTAILGEIHRPHGFGYADHLGVEKGSGHQLIGVWHLPLENLVKSRWYNLTYTPVFSGMPYSSKTSIFVLTICNIQPFRKTPVSGKLKYQCAYIKNINDHQPSWAGPYQQLVAKTRVPRERFSKVTSGPKQVFQNKWKVLLCLTSTGYYEHT